MPRGMKIKKAAATAGKGDERSSAKDGVREDGEALVACAEADYDTLLQAKLDTYHSLMCEMTGFDKSNIEVFESPRKHFRMRANFSIWRDERYNNDPKGMYYAMFDMTMVDEETGRVMKRPCEIKNFPRGSVLINTMMETLMVLWQDKEGKHADMSKALRDDVFEVRFVTTQKGHVIVVLIYRKPLDDDWARAAEEAVPLLLKACDGAVAVKIVGRSKKVKKVVPLVEGAKDEEVEMIEETYTVKGKPYVNYQTEGAFSQPNAAVCEKMLTWSSDVTEGCQDKDLLELYCGGGTFTAALAGNFKRVIATEISKPSVRLAHKTFAANNIDNIKVAALSSEDFTTAFLEKRNLRSLADCGIRITDYDVDTVLVDPPRAGLDGATCALLCTFRAIVYISCNPETLARDVKMMMPTHEVKRMAAFDQFPYTHHLEGGVFLVRREGAATAAEEKEEGRDAKKKVRV